VKVKVTDSLKGTRLQSLDLKIAQQLDVYFIDVGQGDAILLDCGSTEVLIDGGKASPGVTVFIQPYIQGPLEAVVATHMDSDHIGGLTEVIDQFTINEIWTNGDTVNSATYTDFINAVNASTAAKHVARTGDALIAGPLTFSVQNPLDLSGTSNNSSVVLNLVYGSVSFQFEGDAEQESEAGMLSAGLIHHADILKVGHHGSRTASSQAFLSALTPYTAVYMAGVDNTYGHPHSETITALTSIGAKIYGTDVMGTITITTSGKTYQVKTTK
jgi:competence protein ComEC